MKITPKTKRRELPDQLPDSAVKTLDDSTHYHAAVYAATFGVGSPSVALRDFERGIIDPAECRFLGIYRPFAQRRIGEKARIMISGREIQRIYREGRIPGYHAKKLSQRIAADIERAKA